MSAKHTPGPWFLRNLDIYPDMPEGWIVEGANGRHVAIFPRLIDEAKQSQMLDARLIAAAPELLAALRDCREALRRADARGELAVVDAAIAKATGSAE